MDESIREFNRHRERMGRREAGLERGFTCGFRWIIAFAAVWIVFLMGATGTVVWLAGRWLGVW